MSPTTRNRLPSRRSKSNRNSIQSRWPRSPTSSSTQRKMKMRRFLFSLGLLLALGGAAHATQALDGSVQNYATTGNTVTLSLITTGAPGVIVVLCQDAETGGTRSAAGSPLTFFNRVPAFSGTGNYFTEYTAPYTTNFSGTITYTNTSGLGGFASCVAFGISGSATSSYFDPNLSSAVTVSGGGSAQITTTNANDFIFAYQASNNNTTTAGAGWTLIQDGTLYQGAEYQIVSSTQTNLTPTWSGAGTITGTIADAIISGSAPPPTGHCARLLLGVGC
jgi:hypothetical protein